MFNICAGRIRYMAYRVDPIDNVEVAKKMIEGFDYALIYMISEVILKKIDKTDIVESINWEECEEARFFSENKEIHFFRENGKLQAVKTSDDKNESKMDWMQKKYKLASKFRNLGRSVLVKEYLEYDEDGQVRIAQTRLMGIE